MPHYPKASTSTDLKTDALDHLDNAETGARRLLGAGLMGALVVEAVTGLDLLQNPLDLVHGVTLAVMPALAGLGLYTFRRWQACHARWRHAASTIDEHVKARQAAETANEAKSRYLANVSHEIRSPLNAIYGYAQLVERNDGAGAQEAATVIRRCSEHITSLVEALLDISQVEVGVIRVKPEPVRLDQFIEQLIRMVRPAASAKGLDFHYETKGRLPAVVRMDQSRLKQVLLNLLLNAVKYTDQGSVTLFLRYSGQVATFEVRDTGPGIREEDQRAIFEPFDRGGNDALHSRPGVGLGLAIARAIMGILGGQLELAGTSDEGTCFRLTIMLGEVAQTTSQPAKKREVSGYLGRRRHVLICDDDAEQRKFLTELLTSLGFVVQAVPNGETAVALVESESAPAFDLAILDISLPGIDGWTTAQHVRERFGEDIRILMLSANAGEFHRPETRKPVHDQFLVKPVAFNQLIETIGGLLDLAWGVESEPPRATLPLFAASDEAPVSDSGTTEIADRTARLRELLRIGYVRGLEQEIRQLAAQPETAELAGKLFTCLDRFDLSGMTRILEEC
ncbi:ATP-binding protein [Novosphingobium sp. SG707]|uniref:hybrid sensor histidine kinase/response regulator n=1 Tax=Novosphingobium sp. SG707 TaxID=2586996 RepID=UPI001445D9A2|nr:ATP-binding protein [Novosphingobium sp. SG707]NKJ01132.1 signal transduction histidine kinase/DNA-binding response OmpR family regulator [Novosphingobium sp. SG707]